MKRYTEIGITAIALGASVVIASGDQHPLSQLRAEASSLLDVYSSDLATEMLDGVEDLPACAPRTIYIAVRPNKGYSQEQFDGLGDAEQASLEAFDVKPSRYYTTFYGSPLVYARLLDLAAKHSDRFDVDGARIMDLGYGQLGQLRLWAQMGADVVGVEVDPILSAMYTDCEAIGDIENAGTVRLVDGAWPNERAIREEVGSGYDLIVSRNLLKKGYVKPQELNPKFPVPVAWGMDDLEALRCFYDALAPGGLVVIESLGPKPDPEKPWSDISNPWGKQTWIDAGFEVLAHDQDESRYARDMGRSLGWDAQMNLDTDLFGVYSVYRKPTNSVNKNTD